MKKKVFLITCLISIVIAIILGTALKSFAAGEWIKLDFIDDNGIRWNAEIEKNYKGYQFEKLTYVSGDIPADGTVEIPSLVYERQAIYEGGHWDFGMDGYHGDDYINIIAIGKGTCMFDNASAATKAQIKKIVVPSTIKTIGQKCFEGLTNLETVEMAEGVETIGDYFISKTKISELTIPNSVKRFSSYKLLNSDWSKNNYLTKINIGSGAPASDIGPLGYPYYLPNLKTYGATPDSGFIEVDGILYTDEGKTLYAVPKAKDLTNWEVPDEVTKFGDYVFYDHDDGNNLYKLTNAKLFKEGIITIGNYAFYDASLKEALVLPSTVKYIGNEAFNRASIPTTNNFTLPADLEVIGKSAFYNKTSLKGNLIIPDNVKTIGDSAFYKCTGLTGTLTIPDSVETIGNSAFEDCTGLKGKLTIGNGTKTIGDKAFYKSNVYSAENNWYRPTIGSSLEHLGTNFINGKYINDIWIDVVPGDAYINYGYAGTDNTPHVHFRGCTHRVTIGTSEGIRVVNAETNQEMVTGNYECGTTGRYKVVIDEGYDYSNLKVIEINDDKFSNKKIYEYEEGREYDFEELLRNRRIYVETLETGSDLSLRTYITDVNYISVSKVREPLVELSKGKFTYTHTKYPLRVSRGDDVTFKISVYNESVEDVAAQEIKVYIPSGMEMDPENVTNKRYGWTLDDDGNAISTALAGDPVQGYFGNGDVHHKDLSIILKVTEDGTESDIYKTIFAEINGQSAADNDSTPGNVQVSQNYMIDEINASNGNSVIESQEDDDDFETVVLNAKIRVEYNIRVNKIDKDTNQVLRGAKFNLISCGENKLEVTNEDNTRELRTFSDGDVIVVATSDENGIVDFGGVVSYDEGENTYYIEEVDAPESYLANIGQKMKVRVVKTIIDAEKGTYSVKVYCDTSSYTIDTTAFDFTPISTPEQLAKVGSGETVNVNGTDYEYNIDTNYKLINDIDLAGINWTPISNHIKGIFDGDGHKIKNLTIQREASDAKEVGLIGYFSGIVQNLIFEDPNISVSYYDETATSRSKFSGTGCFAGVMEQGAIYNVKTTVTEGSTTAIRASVDNLGGIIGHTVPEGMVTVLNCESNAPVIGESFAVANLVNTRASNVGGMIGCALGSVTFENSVNNAQVTAEYYNAGGLIGFVKPSDYREMFLSAGYDEDNKRIDLLVENTAAEGQYNLSLEIKDRKTSELLGGATYEVDKVENTIMTKLIDTGSLKLFDKVIEYAGKDIYFLTEEETVPGYAKLNGIIKTTIERFWDNTVNDYRVRVEAVLISHKEYQEFIGERETNEDTIRGTEFDRGQIFTDVNIAKANWNGKKVSFEKCINNGEIKANYMNAAGLLGTSYGLVDFNDCTNNGTIKGIYKSGGMIAELRTVNAQFFNNYTTETTIVETINERGVSEFYNCVNNGEIQNGRGNGYSTAGIAAHTTGNVVFKDCQNKGYINGGGALGVIVGEAVMGTTIKNCINKGIINHNADSTNSCGGIIGELITTSANNQNIAKEETYLEVDNCQNVADITSTSWMGGIAGVTNGQRMRINNCSVTKGDSTNAVSLKIVPYGGGTGGIVAGTACEEIILTNNLIKDCEIEITEGVGNSTYCNAAGILACIDNHMNYGESIPKTAIINNCLVQDSTIKGTLKEVGGILGETTAVEQLETTMNNCMVDNCNLQARVPGSGSSYGWLGGIAVGGRVCGNYNIRNCVVIDTNMKVTDRGDALAHSYASIGGIFGKSVDGGTYGDGDNIINIEDCDVVNCDINAYTDTYTPGGTGGIIGTAYVGGSINITRCNVKQSTVKNYNDLIGGVAGQITYVHDFAIKNCNVYETDVVRTKSTPGSQNYNSIAGGILGFSMGPKAAVISDCKVIGKELEKGNENRTKIGVNCNGPAGIVGKAILGENLELMNNTVRNIDIIDNDPVSNNGNYNDIGGIMCFGSFSSTYSENNIVDNCNLDGNKIYNVGGLYGTLEKTITMQDDHVKNTNIINRTNMSDNRQSNVTAGGLIGKADQVNMENCDAKDCKIYCGDHMVAGGIGYTNGAVNASNCSIENVELVDTWENPEGPTSSIYYLVMRDFAGFLGYSNSNGILNNIKVKGAKINAQYAHIGGIVGGMSGDITNCIVENSTFTTTKNVAKQNQAVGGIVAEQARGTNKSNKVLNTTITVDAHLVGGIAGFTGDNYSTDQISIEGAVVDNVTIVHNNIKHPYLLDYYGPYEAAAGGIVGVTYGNVKNSQIKNSSITVKETENLPAQVGGIMGASLSAGTLENSKVINTTVDNKATAGQVGGSMSAPMHSCTGGLVGMATGTLSATGSSVEQQSTVKGTSHVAGLVGYALNNGVTLSNDKVLNATITNNGTDANSTIMGSNVSCTGGAIAIVHDNVSLDGITVKDTTITNTQSNGHIGGVVGVSTGSVKNITMSNVNVSGNGIAGGVGAIIEDKANTTLTAEERMNVISNLTLDTVNVTSKTNHAGGIAGVFNASEVKNATVKNSTIKTLVGSITLGEDILPTCVGAIFGVGRAGIIITSPVVLNNTLTGATGSLVGKYVGAPTEQNAALIAAEQ